MKNPIDAINGTTITVSGFGMEVQEEKIEKMPMLVKPDLGQDGLMATMKALRLMGLDLERVPMAILRMIYFSGVAFAGSDKSTEAERQKWRDSVVWPTIKNSGEPFDVHLYLGKNPKGKKL